MPPNPVHCATCGAPIKTAAAGANSMCQRCGANASAIAETAVVPPPFQTTGGVVPPPFKEAGKPSPPPFREALAEPKARPPVPPPSPQVAAPPPFKPASAPSEVSNALGVSEQWLGANAATPVAVGPVASAVSLESRDASGANRQETDELLAPPAKRSATERSRRRLIANLLMMAVGAASLIGVTYFLAWARGIR